MKRKKPTSVQSRAKSNSTPEESLVRIFKAQARAALQAIQASSIRRGLDKMTMAGIDAVIQDVRRARRA